MDKAIFLSASIPVRGRGDYYKTADPLLIQSAVRTLAEVLLGRNRIVWGGHPTITPMLMEVCSLLNVSYADAVTLYQSRYFEEEFPDDNLFFKNIVFTDKVENDRDASLSLMREKMLSRTDLYAAVFIGGMDGVEKESDLFSYYHPTAKQIFVASTGGAAQEMALKKGMPQTAIYDIDYLRMFLKNLDIKNDQTRNMGKSGV